MNNTDMSNTWKPDRGAALLLGIFTPPIAFLYVNKPKLFLVYWFALTIGYYTVFLYWLTPLVLLFMGLCILHVDSIAKKYEPSSARPRWSYWWCLMLAFVIEMSLFFFLNTFVLSAYRIPSNSMNPNIGAGDMVLTKRWGFSEHDYLGIVIDDSGLSESVKLERSKIYVFKVEGRSYLKRVIGLPGDLIVYDGEKHTINGQPLASEYVSENNGRTLYLESVGELRYLIAKTGMGRSGNIGEWLVPKDHYFVVGDNRDASRDSRFYGPIPADDFAGEVIYVFEGLASRFSN